MNDAAQRAEGDSALHRSLARSSDGFLARHTAAELRERLALIANTPATAICYGWSAPAVEAVLKRWPAVALAVFEPCAALAARARQAARRWLRTPRFEVIEDADAHIEARAQRFELGLSNLALARAATPDTGLERLARWLKPGAPLVFALPGPDTLKELRAAWADDEFAHVATFTDMHDVGSALSRHGFTEAVLNTEHLTLNYSDCAGLWRDLTAEGARNCEPTRARGLTGKQRFAAMQRALAGDNTPFPITVELVFAQCWRANATSADRSLPSGEVRIDLDSLTRRHTRT